MKSIEPPFCLEGKSSERLNVPNSKNLQVSSSDIQFFPKLNTQLLMEEFDMKPADMKLDEFSAKFQVFTKGLVQHLYMCYFHLRCCWRLNGHSVDDLWIC